MLLPANELVALLVAISFAAGLNVYATVATLGVLARFDLLLLPAQLHLLENWWIIGASAILFANRDCAAGDNHPPDPVGDSLSAGLTPRRRAKVSEVIRSRWITIQI